MLKVSAVNHVNVEVPQRLEDTSLERSVDSKEGNRMLEALRHRTEARSRKVVGSNLVSAEDLYHGNSVKYHICYCPCIQITFIREVSVVCI